MKFFDYCKKARVANLTVIQSKLLNIMITKNEIDNFLNTQVNLRLLEFKLQNLIDWRSIRAVSLYLFPLLAGPLPAPILNGGNTLL